MKQFVLITGNQHKADYLRKWLGTPVEHHKVDLDELQSLDVTEIVDHKVRQAYEILKRPVLVEDTSYVMHGLGRLPGPFIKWFLQDLGPEGLCKLARGLDTQDAEVSVTYAYYDGEQITYFDHVVKGRVAPEPRGEHGFGWNATFIPEGSDKTYAEMTDDEIRPFSMRAQAIEKLRDFLEQ
jgi:non-canonical purine NTP pyrophosphatase (RdgB/HAM1 family)